MASINDVFPRVLRPLSTATLRMLHEELRRMMAEDDAQANFADKRYGIRKYPEFRAQADAIERILRNRNESFEPLPW